MTPIVNITGYIKKEEIPSWSIYSNSKATNYYNLTVNGKRCYLTWRDENNCMLYVDGFKIPGFNVENSIYNNLVCEEVFHISLPKLDYYINKAVNRFEQEQKYIKAGLSIDQAKTAIRI
jgi:hypothetical protein